MKRFILLSQLLLLQTHAFVHPFFHTTFASTNSYELNGRHGKRRSTLFSAPVVEETAPAPLSKSQTVADGDEFVKPPLDKRSYRAIKLPNNLQVLLVSDPETDVEAGAVHVKAGHFDDPADRAGLAHFNEHMLFLGSEKYTKEDEFEKFVAKNGGNTNAYTDMEDTNYYFNVAPLDHDDMVEDEEGSCKSGEDTDSKVSLALSGALDRFAQFFIAPLFNEDAVERELRAINSEHLNSFTSESWRNYLLLKATGDQSHPFSKFGCGNYNTLTDGGDIEGTDAASSGGSSPIPALKSFWGKKYVAENMMACVVGRASLDELQKVVEESFEGVRSSGDAKTKNSTDKDVLFSTEHSKNGVAFGKEQMGLFREYVPLVEARSIKLLFATPPGTDPAVIENRPDRVISHLLGHESPGSLHALLLEEGLINGLSSGTGISTSDFSLFSLTIQLTPKGMQNRDHVMSLVWQYISLIKSVAQDDETMSKYHDELVSISKTHFRFQENGDPTDFCSGAAEAMFDYDATKIMVANAFPGKYNADITKAFLERFSPENCIISIQSPDFETESTDENSYECSASSSPWQFEKWYRAKYREMKTPDDLLQKWSNPKEIDSRLHLPGLNTFLPSDFSLRSEDPKSLDSFDETVDYTQEKPKLVVERPGLTLWHKMDRTFKTPKASLRLLLTSPHVYSTPRTMTLNRLFVKILEDDLNSYIYDSALAGCSARVSCVPSGFAISVSGYSEKLPHLLDVVTTRMLTIIEEMKVSTGDDCSLTRKFDKAVKNLLRETKNFRLESPYETASYVSRMLLEDNVWHVKNYVDEMEGDYAEKYPLTLQECVNVAEESLTKRISATFLCMGNIDEEGALNAVNLIDKNFISKARPLRLEEMPKLRSLKMPTKEEAIRIFGPEVKDSKIPIVLEELAYSDSEENHAVEVILQVGAEHELGFDGIGVLELIGQIAYNSAYNQLRTKEQLGYIVSAFSRKTSGSAVGISIVVQSSTTTPVELESRIEAWLEMFREELADMPASDIGNEAAAIVAQLLERNMKLGDEIATSWGSIVSTTTLGSFNKPPFDRNQLLADVLSVEGADIEDTAIGEPDRKKTRKTASELKEQVLAMFDRYLAAGAEERRAIVVRVYGQKAQSEYEENIGNPGYLSSYGDVKDVKQFMSVWPTAPYWIKKNR